MNHGAYGARKARLQLNRGGVTFACCTVEALLRVALERLVNGLVAGSGNLNAKIGELVRRRLPPNVQEAMDGARVLGNDGAHVDALVPTDTHQNATTLFTLINIVVRQMILEPQEIAGIYSTLPEEKRAAIDRRDETR